MEWKGRPRPGAPSLLPTYPHPLLPQRQISPQPDGTCQIYPSWAGPLKGAILELAMQMDTHHTQYKLQFLLPYHPDPWEPRIEFTAASSRWRMKPPTRRTRSSQSDTIPNSCLGHIIRVYYEIPTTEKRMGLVLFRLPAHLASFPFRLLSHTSAIHDTSDTFLRCAKAARNNAIRPNTDQYSPVAVPC